MGGVLAGLYLNDVYPAMGIAMTHKVLALMLIGTLACLRGAVLAAFALALLEGLVLPVIYRPLLSDAMLLVTLAVVSWVGPKRDVIHIGLGEVSTMAESMVAGLITVGIQVILAISVNIISGYARQLSLGQGHLRDWGHIPLLCSICVLDTRFGSRAR